MSSNIYTITSPKFNPIKLALWNLLRGIFVKQAAGGERRILQGFLIKIHTNQANSRKNRNNYLKLRSESSRGNRKIK